MTTAPASKLRAVLDTNVYFSAFTHKGPPFRIWQEAVNRSFILLVSPAILREIAGVLREDLQWQATDIVAHLKLVARIAEIISPKVNLQVIAEDPADDRILECALAGGADLIVSGDRHLRKLKTFRNIGIVQPSDFLRTLG
jgi:putative PIN family toxin of toxin-antitoxin system